MELIIQREDPAVWYIQLLPSPGKSQISISKEGLHAWRQLLSQAESDHQCRILVFEGSHGQFCTGMDLQLLTEQEEVVWSQGLQEFADCIHAFQQSSKITIVQLDGQLHAGGVGLAAAADFLLATKSSRIGLPELTLGIFPAIVLPVLTQRMSLQKVKMFTLMSESIEAQTAHQLGLVDFVAEDAGTLHKELRRLLRQLLRTHPQAVHACKRFCQQISQQTLKEALHQGAQHTKTLLQEENAITHIKNSLEGEPMPWHTRPHKRPPKTT